MSFAFSAVIQAGGKSSRMGTDKALIRFDGQPLIERVLAWLRLVEPAELFIISNDPDPYAHLAVNVYEDRYKESGPLGGLYTALANSRYYNALVVACDMPFLNPLFLRYLVTLQADAPTPYDAIAPRYDGTIEGLHALYHKTALPIIERRLINRQLRLADLFSELNTRYLDEPDYRHLDDGRSFTNVNTPAELQAAERIHEQGR